MKAELNICANLLELIQEGTNVAPTDIDNLKIHKSQIYALGPVYSFNYKNNHFYAVEDYSLDDNPEYVANILLDINPLLKGNILENASQQADSAQYAVSLNDVDYYLWKTPSNIVATATHTSLQ